MPDWTETARRSMVGKTILHYQILQRLGAGGMGEIYKAQDTRLNRVVAIKVLSGGNAGDPELRKRFIQEAQAASSLNHPNIITIHDIVSVGSQQYMVMEFVNGKTLNELIPATGLNPATVLQYAVQIADGLHAAHTVGIVHRDLKPGNIMVTPQGLVKILDFGLAKLTVPSGPVSLTDITQTVGPAPMTIEGSIVGTVSYMSPEQAQGGKVDSRSDIFSFGCVLYEMVTGRKAFSGGSPLLTLTAILRDEPRAIAELAPSVPPELASLIERALRKDAGERWQSMQEMHAELSALKQRSDSGILSASELPAVKPPEQESKSWSLMAMLAIAALALLAGGTWWWTHRPAGPSTHTLTPKHERSPDAPPKPSALAPPILNNQAILDMAKANVPPNVMISQIRSSQTSFSLTTAEIIRLTKGGVPEAVIQAMRDPSGAAAAVAAVQSHTVKISAGEPFEITLLEDVTNDCEPGQRLKFRTSEDVKVDDAIVIAKGSAVTGVVVDGSKKKFLIKTSRPTYRLLEVTAADGSKLKLRATAGRLGESRKDPPLEPIGGGKSKDKDVVAAAGSRFRAWFDGDQSVTVRP